MGAGDTSGSTWPCTNRFTWEALAIIAVIEAPDLHRPQLSASGTPGGLFAPGALHGSDARRAPVGHGWSSQLLSPRAICPGRRICARRHGCALRRHLPRAVMTSVFMTLKVSGNYSIISAGDRLLTAISYFISRSFPVECLLFDLLSRQDGLDRPVDRRTSASRPSYSGSRMPSVRSPCAH